MTASAVSRTAPARAELWPEVKSSAVHLVPGAVLVWLVMCSIGYLLTHPLADAGFTGWEGGVDRWFVHHRSAGSNNITDYASLAGDTPAAIGITVVAFVVLRRFRGAGVSRSCSPCR